MEKKKPAVLYQFKFPCLQNPSIPFTVFTDPFLPVYFLHRLSTSDHFSMVHLVAVATASRRELFQYFGVAIQTRSALLHVHSVRWKVEKCGKNEEYCIAFDVCCMFSAFLMCLVQQWMRTVIGCGMSVRWKEAKREECKLSQCINSCLYRCTDLYSPEPSSSIANSGVLTAAVLSLLLLCICGQT